mmetsp:Transcript_972/g.2840  ORF Transcript_972/g.2840 Transcript_972/m.2840 type:complete len:189 (+) Transcript_972:917-1483(+)
MSPTTVTGARTFVTFDSSLINALARSHKRKTSSSGRNWCFNSVSIMASCAAYSPTSNRAFIIVLFYLFLLSFPLFSKTRRRRRRLMMMMMMMTTTTTTTTTTAATQSRGGGGGGGEKRNDARRRETSGRALPKRLGNAAKKCTQRSAGGIRDGAGTVSGTREASEEDVGKCEGKSDGNGVQRWYMCRG